ncbi:MAG: leucine-rich repeat protein [Verrucomicrobiota bacterium]
MKSRNFHSFAALSAICLTVQPLLADQTSGDFTYTANSKGVTITDFTDSTATEVVIPPQISGKPVTGIGEGAFYNRQNLTSVTIPDSVTHIGEDAFFSCIGLMDLDLPDSLTTVGNGAFASCESLLRISLPSGVTHLGSGAFQACRRLGSVSLPPDITIINRFSFIGCVSLTNITIPKRVTKIGTYAFNGCTALETVKMPGSVGVIDERAFEACFKLKNISLPDGLTKIGHYAFATCRSLTSVIIPASMTRIESGAFEGAKQLTQATFLGDAPPDMAKRTNGAFASVAPDFTIYHLEGKSGFTTPVWQGYPCEVTELAPVIEVRQPTGTSLVDGKAKKSFGTLVVDAAKREKTFTISNNGTADLTGIVVTINGANAEDFKIIAPTKKTLPINGTTTFKVTFKPTGTGPREAEIHIEGKETGENPFDIHLAGMGVK